jgi:uncharacterized damage-inducible protein DinB
MLMRPGLQENIAILRQGEELLAGLNDAGYALVMEPLFDSSLGAHIRHNLDHYSCFLDGLDSGRIDYAARRRSPDVERCRLAAIDESTRLRQALGRLQQVPATLELVAEGTDRARRTSTSMERELRFLLSHTIHHYAIVAIICRLQGHAVPAGFGVAPSTLLHRAGQAA